MKCTINVFGELVELVGSDVIRIETPENSDILKNNLLLQFPSLKNKIFLIAVNKSIINATCIISNTDEIAILPPFSGG